MSVCRVVSCGIVLCCVETFAGLVLHEGGSIPLQLPDVGGLLVVVEFDDFRWNDEDSHSRIADGKTGLVSAHELVNPSLTSFAVSGPVQMCVCAHALGSVTVFTLACPSACVCTCAFVCAPPMLRVVAVMDGSTMW